MKELGDQATWYFSEPSQKVQWPYNRWFRAFIDKRIRYSFVRQHWDREIEDLSSTKILKAEMYDPVAVRLDVADRAVFKRVRDADITRLMAFLDLVATQKAAEELCQKMGIAPDHLMELLQKIYKYLPQGVQMRQLVAPDDPVLQDCVNRLIVHKLGHSLALLEVGRTRQGRNQLVKETGIPEEILLDLVKRADLARLHLMARGMIQLSWELGYKGLAALKKADPEEYYTKCLAYFSKKFKGKPFDFSLKGAYSHVERMQQAAGILEE